jgi:hypothetical protein
VENLKHALLFPAPYLIFHVDSMLVAKQLICEWRCACDAIKPFYEEALDLMARLRAHRTINTVA